MAIIIKSIELCNFYNYYGDYEKNKYEFDEGCNIVVADNGAGKSKLFNSLLWIFKDKVLDSDATIADEKEQDINHPRTAIKVVSSRAKKETEIGGHIECGVKLVYDNGRKVFEINKRFYVIKKGLKYTDVSSWNFDFRDVEITYKEEFGKTKTVFDLEEKNKIINNLIRGDLRQYSFFQGEEVDQIIDFSDPSSIKNAIDILAKVDEIDNLVDYSSNLLLRSEKELKKKRSTISKNKEQISIKESKIESEKRKLSVYEDDLKLYKTEWESANIEFVNYERNISNAEALLKITNKIKDKLRSKSIKEKELENFRNKVNDRFFNGNFAWLSLGMQKISNDYYEIIKTYRTDLAIQKSQGGDVYVPIFPIGSIDIKSLERILEDDKCHVCDRSFENDLEARKTVQKLKDWVSKKEDIGYNGNDLQEFFDDIQLKSQPFTKSDAEIIIEIKNHRLKEKELSNKVKDIVKEIKVLNSEKYDLVGENSSSEDAKYIISGWKSATKRREDYGVKIRSTKERIIETNKKLDSLKEEIEKYSDGVINDREINVNHMLEDIKNAIKETKEDIYTDNIIKLGEKANYYYGQLIKYNNLKGAQLKFEKLPNDGISMNTIGSDGHIVTGDSEGFQRIKKLAVVMGIISLSNTFHYPLFADAPLSTFGEGFIRSFFEVIPNVFPQSIVLIKDIYKADSDSKLDDIGEELYRNPNIKHIYLNELPKGNEQNELETNIIKLK